MQSNDARMLLHSAVPAVITGIIAVAVGGVLAGSKGALGAVIGALVAVLSMGVGLYVLQRTARSWPSLFQMMGLALYAVEFLVLAIVLAVFRHSDFLNPRALGFSLLATTLVWTAAQVRAHMKAKILYVEPESSESQTSAPAGSAS